MAAHFLISCLVTWFSQSLQLWLTIHNWLWFPENFNFIKLEVKSCKATKMWFTFWKVLGSVNNPKSFSLLYCKMLASFESNLVILFWHSFPYRLDESLFLKCSLNSILVNLLILSLLGWIKLWHVLTNYFVWNLCFYRHHLVQAVFPEAFSFQHLCSHSTMCFSYQSTIHTA